MYIADSITAATVASLGGDADLAVINTFSGAFVCFSTNTTPFDSCNNLDGSAFAEILNTETYLLELVGSREMPRGSRASYELDTFDDSETLIPGEELTDVSIAQGDELTFIAAGVSTVWLVPNSGDSDLVVRDITTGAEACRSSLDALSIDSCSVPLGNYLIDVFGFLESSFDLTTN